MKSPACTGCRRSSGSLLQHLLAWRLFQHEKLKQAAQTNKNLTDRETLPKPTPNVTSMKTQFFYSLLDIYNSQVQAQSVWVRWFLSSDVHISVCSLLAESTFFQLHQPHRHFCRQRPKTQRQPTALKLNQHRDKKSPNMSYIVPSTGFRQFTVSLTRLSHNITDTFRSLTTHWSFCLECCVSTADRGNEGCAFVCTN